MASYAFQTTPLYPVNRPLTFFLFGLNYITYHILVTLASIQIPMALFCYFLCLMIFANL